MPIEYLPARTGLNIRTPNIGPTFDSSELDIPISSAGSNLDLSARALAAN